MVAPGMPQVDTPPNLAGVFSKIRARVANAGAAEGMKTGQRCVGVVTPGRMTMLVPAPVPGSIKPEFVDQVRALLPAGRPLNVAAISYTQLEALRVDVAKCIPMLAQLLGLAYVGHNVIVFEGHPSAFAAVLVTTDVLLVDSGMLPFLQKDWTSAAVGAMRPGSRILINDRKTGQSRPVKPSYDEKGWRLVEPDGEASYTNCLLTTLAKSPATRVEVAAAPGVPPLDALTGNARELAWIAELPFRYKALDGAKVIAILRKVAKWSLEADGATTGTLRATLATGAGRTEDVAFQLRLLQDALGRDRVEIEKTELVSQ